MTHQDCIARIIKDIKDFEARGDTRHAKQAYLALAAEAKAAAKEIKTTPKEKHTP